jgi:hypothetical protein
LTIALKFASTKAFAPRDARAKRLDVDLAAQLVDGHARLVGGARLLHDRLHELGDVDEILLVAHHQAVARNDRDRVHRLDLAQDRGPLADVRLRGERERMHEDVAGDRDLRIGHVDDCVARGVRAPKPEDVDVALAQAHREALVEGEIRASVAKRKAVGDRGVALREEALVAFLAGRIEGPAVEPQALVVSLANRLRLGADELRAGLAVVRPHFGIEDLRVKECDTKRASGNASAKMKLPPTWSLCQCVLTTYFTGFGVSLRISSVMRRESSGW